MRCGCTSVVSPAHRLCDKLYLLRPASYRKDSRPISSAAAMSSMSYSFRAFTGKLSHHHQSASPILPIGLNLISCSHPRHRLRPSSSLFKSISFQRVATSVQLPHSLPPTQPSSSIQRIEELPPKLQEMIKLFQSVEQPKAKYEQLLFYGRNLSPLDERFKTRENRVEGCVSQVWVRAILDDDKNVWFEADSDAIITKGLAALLVQGFSGRPVAEILNVSPDFVIHLGLHQSLSPSRNNGFLNMLKLMQRKALLLAVEAEKKGEERMERGTESLSKSDSAENGSSSSRNGNESSDSSSDLGLDTDHQSRDLSSGAGSRVERIKLKLGMELHPLELEIEDVSGQHAGHTAMRGRASHDSDEATHLNLRIVSKEFEGKSTIKRHRMIYALLQDELQSGLHALSIVAKAPHEPHEVDAR